MSWSVQPLPANGPLFEGAISVYAEAFARPPYSDPGRGREIRQRMRETHRVRKDFRSFVAVHGNGRPIGMIYGYHGALGQWWHDTVANRLTNAQYDEWLADSYELVEVAVAPAFQSLGVGRALIDALLEGRCEATCVLSTRTDSRAHHLYRRMGFETILEMTFVTGGFPFYVMGKRLDRDDVSEER